MILRLIAVAGMFALCLTQFAQAQDAPLRNKPDVSAKSSHKANKEVRPVTINRHNFVSFKYKVESINGSMTIIISGRTVQYKREWDSETPTRSYEAQLTDKEYADIIKYLKKANMPTLKAVYDKPGMFEVGWIETTLVLKDNSGRQRTWKVEAHGDTGPQAYNTLVDFFWNWAEAHKNALKPIKPSDKSSQEPEKTKQPVKINQDNFVSFKFENVADMGRTIVFSGRTVTYRRYGKMVNYSQRLIEEHVAKSCNVTLKDSEYTEILKRLERANLPAMKDEYIDPKLMDGGELLCTLILKDSDGKQSAWKCTVYGNTAPQRFYTLVDFLWDWADAHDKDLKPEKPSDKNG